MTHMDFFLDRLHIGGGEKEAFAFNKREFIYQVFVWVYQKYLVAYYLSMYSEKKSTRLISVLDVQTVLYENLRELEKILFCPMMQTHFLQIRLN